LGIRPTAPQRICGKENGMKMPRELKEKWIAALRSGEYPQTRGVLRGYNGFCCLGVLQEVRKIPVYEDSDGNFKYEGKGGSLGEKTCELFSCDAWGFVVGGSTIAELNDSGVSFTKIADLIEEHVEVSDPVEEPNVTGA